MKKLKIIDLADEKKKMQMQMEKDKENKGVLINFALIIEGSAITICLEPELKDFFWKLIKKCRSLICCRCNPLQNAEIVKFVRDNSNELVLAIGDGGNDVNMITVKNYLNFTRKQMWE